MDKFISYFYCGSKVDENYKDAVSYIYLAIIGVMTLWAYSCLHFFKYKIFELGTIYQVSALFLIIQLFLSKKIKNYQLNYTIGLVILQIPIFSGAYYLGGEQSPIIFWTVLLIMLAKMFGTKKCLIAVSLASFIGLLSFIYLSKNGIVYERQIFSDKGLFYYKIFTLSMFALVMVVTTSIYRRILDDSIKQLSAKNEQVNHFIRILCHDIANPLTVIQGRSRMGTKKVLEEKKQLKYFTDIHRASELVTQILDEVRAYEAVNDGKINIQNNAVLLSELLNDIDFIFEDKLNEKELVLKITGLNYSKIKVLCEKDTFKGHVLNNIISNAIKFSLKGGIIELNISKKDNNIIFNIIDSGIGIPDNLITKLFDLGEETSRLGTEGERGTGFGLPLVKTYIESYEGQIEISSTEKTQDSTDHGTSFKISLKSAA